MANYIVDQVFDENCDPFIKKVCACWLYSGIWMFSWVIQPLVYELELQISWKERCRTRNKGPVWIEFFVVIWKNFQLECLDWGEKFLPLCLTTKVFHKKGPRILSLFQKLAKKVFWMKEKGFTEQDPYFFHTFFPILAHCFPFSCLLFTVFLL